MWTSLGVMLLACAQTCPLDDVVSGEASRQPLGCLGLAESPPGHCTGGRAAEPLPAERESLSNGSRVLTQPPVGEHLGCFQVLGIMRKAALNVPPESVRGRGFDPSAGKEQSRQASPRGGPSLSRSAAALRGQAAPHPW